MRKKAEFNKLVKQWHHKIVKRWHDELSQRLTELELSALYSCIPDCFESMYEIYYESIPNILRTRPNDYEKLHDYFFDIGGLGGAFSHIKNHITDAERGFQELLNLLAEKAEKAEKQGSGTPVRVRNRKKIQKGTI